MIAIREYPSGKVWTCPGLTMAEAKATEASWRKEWKIDCAAVKVMEKPQPVRKIKHAPAPSSDR